VNTARESFARTFTFVSIVRVSKEWRRTNTLSRLNTDLISSTIVVPSTSGKSRRASFVVRVSLITRGTDAFKSARLVVALGPYSTCPSIVPRCTLVNL